MDAKTLYKQQIIDNYKNPKNFGTLENANMKSKVANLSCGDEIELYILEKDGVVEEVKFNGSGCAISIASASLLTEKLKGQKVEDVMKIKSEEVLKMIGMEKESPRVKCGLLALEGVKRLVLSKRGEDN